MAGTIQSITTGLGNLLGTTNDQTNREYVTIKNNTKNFKNFSYFLGGIDVTHQNLDKFTPYIRGVSRIFLHKPPQFLNTPEYAEYTSRFKQYIESGYKSINGINDVSVEFTDYDGGFAGQRFQTVQLAKDEADTLTITVYELSGSPVREYIDLWVTGTRDPRSGIAHYHGQLKTFGSEYASGVSYGEINHTAEFIYTTYDPTGISLEYSCMFANCFPRKVPKEHLNYESGNRDNVQMDLEFSTFKYESPAINDIGIWYTLNSKVDWNYLDFNPNKGTSGDNNGGYMEKNPISSYNYGSDGNINMREGADVYPT